MNLLCSWIPSVRSSERTQWGWFLSVLQAGWSLSREDSKSGDASQLGARNTEGLWTHVCRLSLGPSKLGLPVRTPTHGLSVEHGWWSQESDFLRGCSGVQVQVFWPKRWMLYDSLWTNFEKYIVTFFVFCWFQVTSSPRLRESKIRFCLYRSRGKVPASVWDGRHCCST